MTRLMMRRNIKTWSRRLYDRTNKRETFQAQLMEHNKRRLNMLATKDHGWIPLRCHSSRVFSRLVRPGLAWWRTIISSIIWPVLPLTFAKDILRWLYSWKYVQAIGETGSKLKGLFKSPRNATFSSFHTRIESETAIRCVFTGIRCITLFTIAFQLFFNQLYILIFEYIETQNTQKAYKSWPEGRDILEICSTGPSMLGTALESVDEVKEANPAFQSSSEEPRNARWAIKTPRPVTLPPCTWETDRSTDF